MADLVGGVLTWDVATRATVADIPLTVYRKDVPVAYSRDGKILAAGCRGGVMLWDVAAGRRLVDEPLAVPRGDVGALAISPDGRTLAAGFGALATGVGAGRADSAIVLWDVPTRTRLTDEPLWINARNVEAVAFSPDGKTLAAGLSDPVGVTTRRSQVVFWDVAARRRLAEDPLRVEGRLSNVTFSPDGRTLAAGFNSPFGDGVVLWDVAARKRVAGSPVSLEEGNVLELAFSPDEKALAVGCGRGVVLWDLVARRRLADEPLPVPGRVGGIAFSPDGRAVAVAYRDGVSGGVMLWDAAAPARRPGDPLAVREGAVNGLAFDPDGRVLAAGYSGGSVGGVVLWDLATRRRLGDGPLAVAEGYVRHVAFAPDGKTLAAGYDFGGPADARSGVVLWDAAARRRLADLPLRAGEGTIAGLAFSRDGKTLAAGCNSVGGVVLWDLATRRRLADQPLPVIEGHVQDVAFSPDGKALAAGYYERAPAGRELDFSFRPSGGVVFWDAVTHRRLADGSLSVKEGMVARLAFSRDGKTLAAGYQSGRRRRRDPLGPRHAPARGGPAAPAQGEPGLGPGLQPRRQDPRRRLSVGRRRRRDALGPRRPRAPGQRATSRE